MDEYWKTKELWYAVNACSHYRKCDDSEAACQFIQSLNLPKKIDNKLKSALWTTYGGALRDTGDYTEAIEFALQAHHMTPKNYRPCTLLGALYFEIGKYETGSAWYVEAVKRGHKERSVDDDLRSILLKASPDKRAEMSAYLLKKDAIRYEWVTRLQNKKATKKT